MLWLLGATLLGRCARRAAYGLAGKAKQKK